ncbi:hypothetical protein EYF80_050634 [Liparis tanakae]|uniref:Uncharacterized protein n=1 Tax=Liparis tanakae TaxID=230148 RepID=A0A4Z2FEJ6_9TELE|nr:hypothetical protein EYF80_050634 [Liparis tanakae]
MDGNMATPSGALTPPPHLSPDSGPVGPALRAALRAGAGAVGAHWVKSSSVRAPGGERQGTMAEQLMSASEGPGCCSIILRLQKFFLTCPGTAAGLLRESEKRQRPNVTRHFLEVTSHFLEVTSHFLKVTSHFLKVTSHFLEVTSHFLEVTSSLTSTM